MMRSADMNNLLLVGNGFDLAHGLLTKYENFLYVMKDWNTFYDAFLDERSNAARREKGELTFWDFFPKGPNNILEFASKMDIQHINQLGDIIKRNSWIYYYCNCEAEIDGWIDFEKEIYPVIELFEFIFDYDYQLEYGREGSAYITIPIEACSAKTVKMAGYWDKYIGIGYQSLYVKKEYTASNYGVLKKKILSDLRREFDEFVKAFEIYLVEFVDKRDNVKKLKQIEDIGVTTVISFNYTFTEKLYGVKEEDVHHIHGTLREDLSSGKNNMVMGVNKQDETNMDFIYFVKYFQRIQKASGVKYKELIQKEIQDGNRIHTAYVLHIYGHSLDETDEDILKYVIGEKNEYGALKLKPKKVIIYYYDDADYEQKVINLIKLYGRQIVEKYMEAEAFKFIEIVNECVNKSL